jgi:hypothetical protein
MAHPVRRVSALHQKVSPLVLALVQEPELELELVPLLGFLLVRGSGSPDYPDLKSCKSPYVSRETVTEPIQPMAAVAYSSLSITSSGIRLTSFKILARN